MADKKERHGCLTAWLVFMIIASSITAMLNLVGGSTISEQFPDAPSWAFPLLAVLGALNVGFAIALFKWKKWGFYGFCGTAIVAFMTNLSVGVGLAPSIFGLVGVAILYGVLHIGNERKAWPNLD